ncbi:methyltransferase domain-containing protein [Actinomycetospora termitidis]|uniref:Methyltransferase domain-containing protein n=1 Tax=Actinomycetospora termitidis TaxID=3053470 RepID=A0ABT7M257_9PSEU|nr:methyltransferase domain-containing protein [Actinomycetospora sp. Odt1-22]MDL5154745.1 methyltransferase domain-containing protein [Actinomycetospora sp. Odt1-22]
MTSTVNGFGAAATPAALAGAGQAGHLGTEAARREHGRLGEGRYRGPGALAEARRALRVALPEPSSRFSQDDEWCVVAQPDGSWSEFRFHDYHRIFDVPGLYEKIFYDVLGCDTPRFMADLFAEALAGTREEAGDVRVLDLGAGNGIMAEELATVGVPHAVGVDILPEAQSAAERDRPGLYADYLVADLTALDPAESRRLLDHRLNALTVVAALGFGDIPPAAFRTAYDHIADGGWVVLTIKDAFLAEDDTSGFARMIADGLASGALEVVRRERFRHRLATDASPLVYEGIVARKRGPLG